jgi:hypothetical protein
LNDDDYGTFQRELADNPEAGDLIKGTGGLRKIRLAAKGHGKSGGVRVVYYHVVFASRIALIFAYPKTYRAILCRRRKRR